MMIKILYVFTSCKKSGPTQQILYLIKNLDRNIFEPHFVTIYKEKTDGTSILDWYLPYVKSHICIETNKLRILLNKTKSLDEYVEKLNPDIIHTLGVFPDYHFRKHTNHIFTCRNYIFDDYPSRYGWIKGNILSLLHLIAIKKTKEVQCCSKSLHEIYLKKMNINIPFIQNGVDTSKFSPIANYEDKYKLRENLKLPVNKKIFIYCAEFNNRKNQEFLLKTVSKNLNDDDVFLFLGEGPNYNRLKMDYGNFANTLFLGEKKDITEYLKASDFFISTSKSEGLPNGVLEAMATGLPVLLSDIPQHKELFCDDEKIGLTYEIDNEESLINKINEIKKLDYDFLSKNAFNVVNKNFSALVMSKNYQKVYRRIMEENSDYE